MSPQHSLYRQTKFFGSLDGLRCISILAVIFHHAAGHHYAGSPLSTLGSTGVMLFFTISGFLITTLLLREQERHGQIDLTAFYARRSLRIFPLYYTILLVYVLLALFVERDPAVKAQFFHNLPAFATYTSNWFVDLNADRVIFYFAWSLATEEQFYLLWPSVEQRTKRAAPYVMGALIVFVELVRMQLIPLDPAGLPYRIITSFAPAIGLGVILAHLLHHERSFAVMDKLIGGKWSSLVFALLLIACIALGAPELVIFTSMALLIGACCIREDSLLAPLLRLPVMARAGTVSYGMYLMHMILLNIARKLCERVGIESAFVHFAVASVGVFGVAWFSYTYYESQFLKLKTRFVR